MAKAAPIENIDPNDPQSWFAEVLSVRFEEVLQFTDAALDPDGVEGVHDIRVALRRLRSILRDVPDAAEKRLIKQLNRSLKDLADNLGKVRDLDVLIEALEKLREQAEPAAVDGINQIISTYKEARTARHRELEQFLTGELVLELRTRLNAVQESVARRRVLAEFPSVRELGSDVIADNHKQFRRRSKALYRPFSTERLHDLRIAGKRLRYAIDLFAPHFDEALQPFAAGMKEMQSHLGSLHDHDSWIGEIRNHIAEEASRTTATWLLSQFVRRRTDDYLDALQLSSNWETEQFFSRLDRSTRAFS